MRRLSTVWALLREAMAASIATPVASALIVVMSAGMCGAVLLTTGRTQAATESALAALDAAGTRSIVLRAPASAGLTSEVVGRLRPVTAVELVTAFGPVLDVSNLAVPGGPLLGVRPVYGDLGLEGAMPGQIYAAPAALERLGMIEGSGAATTLDGAVFPVRSGLKPPDHLGFLRPLAVLLPEPAEPGPVTMLVVLVDEPRHVALVADVVNGLLGDVDRAELTVETSEELARVRMAVSGELGGHSHLTVLAILAVASSLVGCNLLGMVLLRRRDFGRRRALGASQALLIALLLTQTAMLAALGAVLGAAATLLLGDWLGDPMPGVRFVVALVIAAIWVSVLAALLPAVVAARREPLYELRVP